jgi:TorA maturation chaperone TorD
MKEHTTGPDTAQLRKLAAITHGYDYLATIWLDGPLRLTEPALQAWLADLAPAEPALAARFADLIRMLDGDDERTAADEDFQGSLVVPQPGRYLPPYASSWTGSTDELWSSTTMRVLRCYSQAGLDWQQAAPDSDRPWVRAPDHLGIECAFIAELTTAAAQGPVSAADPPRSAGPGALATSFVIDHIRTWVPAYAARLSDHARSRYWQDAAEVLAAWVRRDSLLPSGAGWSGTGQVPAAVSSSQPPG